MVGKEIHLNNCAIPVSFLKAIVLCLKPLDPSRILLFGSSIMKGVNARDIDIIIISNRFSNIFWNERKKMVNLPQGLKYDLNLLTEEEFEVLSNQHILKQGLEVGYVCLEGLM